MKRMSDVFELPVSDMDLAYLTSQAEDGSMTFAENKRCKHAAHAINNVDALADELAAIVADYEINGFVDKLAISAAKNVINTYRGTK